jgi:hypothetical protein
MKPALRAVSLQEFDRELGRRSRLAVVARDTDYVNDLITSQAKKLERL